MKRTYVRREPVILAEDAVVPHIQISGWGPQPSLLRRIICRIDGGHIDRELEGSHSSLWLICTRCSYLRLKE